MKKRMIKIIATALSVVMLMSCISMFGSISASTSSGSGTGIIYTQDDFAFEENEDGTCKVIAYGGDGPDVAIPARLDNGKLVTIIGDGAFEGKECVETVSIPLSVTIIEDAAFFECVNLKSISVSRVREIGFLAFANCSSLEKIVIPETVRVVEGGAYAGAKKAEGVNIVNPLVSIADNAFEDCPILTIYGYPDSTALEYAIDHDINFESLVPEIMYDDMNSNHWWYQAVNFANAYDLLTGTMENGEYNFNPTDNITRADAVRMLWAFEGKPVGHNSTFTDVPTLYDNAIGWAQENEISSGISDTLFGTGNTVTKLQLVVFLYRYTQYKGYDTDIDGYSVPATMTDFNSIPSNMQDAVTWAAKNNIISTTAAFSPNANATRAIAATVIYMFMENVEC